MTSGGSTYFQYRLPRFLYGFRLALLSLGVPVEGRCLNLSETGMLALLEYPVETTGPHTLRLILPTWTVDLDVEIAYSDGCRSGLRFLFGSEQQRQFVRAIVHVAG